jgi:hypothetical protein
LAKPFYEATKWGKWEPMVWREEQEKAFKEIKRALINAPALSLPSVIKPFFVYVHEKLGTAVGFLSQLLGSWHHLVAYLLKQFPKAGHPACAPWWLLLFWWLKQTNLLWDKNSESEFCILF